MRAELSTRNKNILAAMVHPFLLQAVFVVLASSVVFGFTAFHEVLFTAISSATGFVFIVRAARILSVAIAFVYFPAMILLLPRFAWLLTGLLYGVWD